MSCKATSKPVSRRYQVVMMRFRESQEHRVSQIPDDKGGC